MAPPFLQEGEGVVGGRDDMFQAVGADRIVSAFCSSIGEFGVGDGREEVGERGFVVKKESDGSRVESKLNGGANFSGRGVMGEGDGLE